MSAVLTRRAALSGAVASVALVGAAAAATMPIAHQAGAISPALLDLIRTAEAAEAENYRYHRAVYEPATKRRREAIKAAEASIPHISVDAGPNAVGGRVVWTSERPQMAHTVLGMADEGRAWEHDYLAAARRIVANDLRRKRAVKRADKAHDTSPLVDRSNALCDAWAAASNAVGAFAAATPADLHAKLAFMVANDMGDGQDWLAELLADAARLAKMEG